jgi:hypothetical protein
VVAPPAPPAEPQGPPLPPEVEAEQARRDFQEALKDLSGAFQLEQGEEPGVLSGVVAEARGDDVPEPLIPFRTHLFLLIDTNIDFANTVYRFLETGAEAATTPSESKAKEAYGRNLTSLLKGGLQFLPGVKGLGLSGSTGSRVGSAQAGTAASEASASPGGAAAAGAAAESSAAGAGTTAANETFSILDGVRRAKAALMSGHTVIAAEVEVGGKTVASGSYPISSLLSPKQVIDTVSNPSYLPRWLKTLRLTASGSPPPAIRITPGGQGTPINQVRIGKP